MVVFTNLNQKLPDDPSPAPIGGYFRALLSPEDLFPLLFFVSSSVASLVLDGNVYPPDFFFQ